MCLFLNKGIKKMCNSLQRLACAKLQKHLLTTNILPKKARVYVTICHISYLYGYKSTLLFKFHPLIISTISVSFSSIQDSRKLASWCKISTFHSHDRSVRHCEKAQNEPCVCATFLNESRLERWRKSVWHLSHCERWLSWRG